MKISIKNLGAIKKAEFTLGELTIICGENNTGKTYATHATFGFFDYIRSNANFPVNKDIMNRLYSEGSVSITLQPYFDKLQTYLDAASVNYSKIMHRIFAGNESLFESAELNFSLETFESFKPVNLQMKYGSAEKTFLQISLSEDGQALDTSLIVEKDLVELPQKHIVEEMISAGISASILGNIVPKPFLSSAERTGAAIFQRELDFTKNRLVELLGDKFSKLHPMQLFK